MTLFSLEGRCAQDSRFRSPEFYYYESKYYLLLFRRFYRSFLIYLVLLLVSLFSKSAYLLILNPLSSVKYIAQFSKY